jgi:hypothetical protein
MILADSIYLSVIHRPVAGDVLFPPFSNTEFIKQSSEYVEASEPYTIEIYKRPAPLKTQKSI